MDCSQIRLDSEAERGKIGITPISDGNGGRMGGSRVRRNLVEALLLLNERLPHAGPAQPAARPVNGPMNDTRVGASRVACCFDVAITLDLGACGG